MSSRLPGPRHTLDNEGSGQTVAAVRSTRYLASALASFRFFDASAVLMVLSLNCSEKPQERAAVMRSAYGCLEAA